MTKRLKGDWEHWFMAENGVGLVDVYPEHVLRVAQIISERHPGVVLTWEAGRGNRPVTIGGVNVTRRAFSPNVENKLVAASQRIAQNVAKKYPRRTGLFGAMFPSRVKRGMCWTPKE